MGSHNSVTGDNSFQSTHAVISIVAGLAACVLIVACVVLFKRKTSLSLTSHKDYRGYCPSPFDPTRRLHRTSSCASPQGSDLSMASGGEVTPSTIIAGEDELSSSYRTCSRHYSERISSETSWAVTSSRTIEFNDAENKNDTVKPATQANQQRTNRVAMAFEDSFLDEEDSQDIDQARARARDNSDSSSALFSTFMESERSSIVSWSLSSSWSGSEVSSLESTRATDVSLSDYSTSGSSSRSFRISSGVDEYEIEKIEAHGAKDNEPRLPEATTISITSGCTRDIGSEQQSRCDTLLLFKPIKARLLRPKLKKPAMQQSAVSDDEDEASVDEAQVWHC